MSKPYVILPAFTLRLAADKELWLLYGYLLSKANDNGEVTLPSTEICTMLNLSRQRFRTLLGRLVENGLATKHQPAINQHATNITLDYQLINRDEQPAINQLPTSYQPAKRVKRATKFTPPTDKEVADYVAKMGYHFNPEQFVPFYQSKGWMVGKTPMKDWRASCRTWEIEWKKKHGEQFFYEIQPNTTGDTIATRAQSRDRLRALATGVVSQSADKLFSLYNGAVQDTDNRAD